MLILSRERGEQILIGDDIVITSLGAGPNGEQRLGIDAPRSVPILRAEIVWKYDVDGNKIK